ncbi:LysR family transcriptional regulator [Aestuariivirga sp.]|jgi:DNA-binding transcriptional LysR family regulator|uniref:LysR family transcriptional regulator n=1 Tax=Aestuariivirga sp. TaxID=2650926 RepID=UPI0037839A5E
MKDPEEIMAPFNSRDLQAFMAIAEELSFRKAAERIFIDQSALSRRIQNLEDGLGYQLIFRTTREVVLTEAGRVFYEEIAPAMQALARAGEVARVAAEGKSGRLRLAYMSFAAPGVMPAAIRDFAAQFPDVALELRYLRTQAQKLAISRGDIDAGFMLGPFQNPQFDQVAVASETLVALIPEDHPLARLPAVTLAELAAQRLILGSHDQWDFFRMLVGDLFSAAGLSMRVAYEPSNTLGILGLVAAGLGVSLYAESISRLRAEGVVIRPITDCATRLETILCWNRANQSPALRNFVARARQEQRLAPNRAENA